ncbi:hypothetical protein BDY21DRAFT_364467 [Lineolata rhizophorae]|uniref:Uncharacterized protein n=1 Tax=Lineolata rhizophorae TaxID=578093 RepID=A0A6A6NZA4_9PEZI|nr:hypothetical protein BDY21DRAFT_364467 [Lineolata rhizophorae]
MRGLHLIPALGLFLSGLILSCHGAESATLAAASNENGDNDNKYGGECPLDGPVFGIELTLDSLASSVVLPNGTRTGLATVEGDDDYRALMRDWLAIAEGFEKEKKVPYELINSYDSILASTSPAYKSYLTAVTAPPPPPDAPIPVSPPTPPYPDPLSLDAWTATLTRALVNLTTLTLTNLTTHYPSLVPRPPAVEAPSYFDRLYGHLPVASDDPHARTPFYLSSTAAFPPLAHNFFALFALPTWLFTPAPPSPHVPYYSTPHDEHPHSPTPWQHPLIARVLTAAGRAGWRLHPARAPARSAETLRDVARAHAVPAGAAAVAAARANVLRGGLKKLGARVLVVEMDEGGLGLYAARVLPASAKPGTAARPGGGDDPLLAAVEGVAGVGAPFALDTARGGAALKATEKPAKPRFWLRASDAINAFVDAVEAADRSVSAPSGGGLVGGTAAAPQDDAPWRVVFKGDTLGRGTRDTLENALQKRMGVNGARSKDWIARAPKAGFVGSVGAGVVGRRWVEEECAVREAVEEEREGVRREERENTREKDEL